MSWEPGAHSKRGAVQQGPRATREGHLEVCEEEPWVQGLRGHSRRTADPTQLHSQPSC